MVKQPPFPPLSPSLVEALNRLYPARCARLNQGMPEIWMEAGSRKVVEFLIEELKRQDKPGTIIT